MEVLIMVYGTDLFNKKKKTISIYLFCLGHLQFKVILIYFHIFMHGMNNSHLSEIKVLMRYLIMNMFSIEIKFNPTLSFTFVLSIN
jgi:hypothetical protein